MNPLPSPSALSADPVAIPVDPAALSAPAGLPQLPASDLGLYQLFYQSQATGSLPALEQLRAILDHSRAYNAAQHITGVLLSSEGYFVQLLEGPEAAVRTLYASIKQDPRHRRVRLVREQAVARRSFPHWHMGFGQVAAAELARVVQAVQLRTTGRTPRLTDSTLRTLWQAIRAGQR